MESGSETTESLEQGREGMQDLVLAAQILGVLYLIDPKEEEVWLLLTDLREMPGFDDWPFGTASELASSYQLMSEGLAAVPDLAEPHNSLTREYQRLFIGPEHFNAPAWGSVYLDRESVLFGSSTLELRKWMREQGIAVTGDDPKWQREPEDHIGRMLILLRWLAEEKPELIHEFLARHLMPWAPRYLELLQKDARQPFYEGLAILTNTILKGVTASFGVEPVKRKLYF
jgi:TorA maturation chaperone TorD